MQENSLQQKTLWRNGEQKPIKKGRSFMKAAKRLVILSALLALGLPVCGAETVRMTLWNLPETRLFHGVREAIREFERRTGVVVDTGASGNLTDQQKLMTAAAAGTPPDLLWQDRFTISSWAFRGAFLPLDEYIQRDGIRQEDYYDACWNEVVYDGQVYGLPWNTDARALFYNRDIFAAEGLDHPPRDWEELQQYAARLTQFHQAKGYYERIGFAPNYGNAWLYLYGWLNGGRFMKDQGRTCSLADPAIVEALQYMTETYDLVGGAQRVTAFEVSSQLEGVADPFLAGRIAMKIDGNWVLDYLVKYKPEFNFGVAPPPAPKGKPPLTWSGGFAWAIPKDADHPELAWELAKWLNSEEAWLYAGEAQVQFNRREGFPYYIPMLSANRKISHRMAERFTPDLPTYREAVEVFLNLLEVSKFRPVTPVGTLLWDEHARAMDQAIRHVYSPQRALEEAQRRVQRELDTIYAETQALPMNWRVVWTGIGALALAVLGVIATRLRRWRGRVTRAQAREAWTGMAFCSPWMLGFVIFLLGPMIFSAILVFCRYSVLQPAEFIGLENLRHLFGFHRDSGGALVPNDRFFWKSLWNTGYIVLFGVPGAMLVSFVMALLVNTDLRGVHIFRTLFYLPVVVPLIVVAFVFMQLLNPETGLLSAVMNRFLIPLGYQSPNWFGDPKWSKPGILLMLFWTSGGTMIIWLAGLKSIPRHLYEVAEIDGAGVWQRFLNVTLPMLSPYIFFNLVMGIIANFQVFTQAYVLAVPPTMGPGDSLMFLVIYLFRSAFAYLKMGYACALAWVLFFIILLLTIIQLKMA
ncbi:MAG TPA: extracellular solute-binding protein, partial [Firmicutes bacterium]|nr:extracellular solute-binding protein [Bacillota bacterium]